MSRKITMMTAAVVVLLVTSVTLMAMPVQAQVTGHGGNTAGLSGGSIPLPAGVTPDVSYTSLSHISFRPNPIGIGQPLLVNLFCQPPIHVARYFQNAFLVTFTKPDGTTDTVGPLSSYYGDTTAWFQYTADQVGTWTIKFDFLGAYFPSGNYTSSSAFTLGQTLNAPLSIYYMPSHDGPYKLTVQTNVALSWPGSPLPTDYWTRPVSPESREWWPILGSYPNTGVVGGGPNWPADTNPYMSNYKFIPYVQGPNSAHIVWQRQGSLSGLIGGPLGQLSLFASAGGPSIVYAGRAYQTVTKIEDGGSVSVWQCYDIRTGEVYWERYPATQVPNAVVYTTRTFETVPGEVADSGAGLAVNLMYVGGGRVIYYDPWTGDPVSNRNVSISPLSSGTYYAMGETFPIFLTVQSVSGGKYRLINFSITGDTAFGGPTNLRLDVLNNVSWPFSSLGTVDYEAGIAVNTQGITPSSTGVAYGQMIMGASLTTGQLLWNVSTNISLGYEGVFSGSTTIADHGKFAVRLNDGRWHCYDLYSGKELWVSELSSYPWGIWGIYGESSAYGLLIYPQYDGVVAYNWTNGKIVWRYKYVAPYPYETVYADDNTGEALYPFYDSVVQIVDGKIYTSNTEHTASEPITRGWKLHCINATTGEGIWNISGSMAANAVADGYLIAGDRYNGFQYVFGKGLSATIVTAPDVSVPLGTSLVIKGTVLDQSPAQPGTPCVSKDSMATQMEYLHMQHPIDGVAHNLTITGVPVILTAIGSDGSVIDLGTVTTNGYYGTFSKTWTPPKEGDYTIIAQFAGDDSYGSSSAGTSIDVGPAPETPSGNGGGTEVVAPDNTMLLYGILAGVVIAIILAAIAILVVLRKR